MALLRDRPVLPMSNRVIVQKEFRLTFSANQELIRWYNNRADISPAHIVCPRQEEDRAILCASHCIAYLNSFRYGSPRRSVSSLPVLHHVIRHSFSLAHAPELCYLWHTCQSRTVRQQRWPSIFRAYILPVCHFLPIHADNHDRIYISSARLIQPHQVLFTSFYSLQILSRMILMASHLFVRLLRTTNQFTCFCMMAYQTHGTQSNITNTTTATQMWILWRKLKIAWDYVVQIHVVSHRHRTCREHRSAQLWCFLNKF